MAKVENTYIRKAKRKRTIKRIFILVIFLIIGTTIFVTKTNFFKIDTIECSGEVVVTKEYIMEKSKELLGANIFNINNKKVKNLLKDNPYIESATVTRKIPRKIIINAKEKKGLFYIKNGEKYNIVSSDLNLLEEVDNIEGRKLIEINGLSSEGKSIGEKINDNKRIEDILDELYKEEEVIRNKNEEFSITGVDLKDLSKIEVYLGNIVIHVGSDVNIRSKMSNAINVYKSGLVTEFIDVSFNGTPDFK